MNNPNLGEYVECPQCGSDEEATYTEVDGVIYIECSACGYFEEADFLEFPVKDDEEDSMDSYMNSTDRKEKLPDEEQQWIYYNLFLKKDR
jgi:uncharacterized Zn finger protein